jgi:flagellum-specific ATP synthase
MPKLPDLELERLTRGLEDCCFAGAEGRVSQVVGLTIESIGPRSSVGDTVLIQGDDGRLTAAEVAGFRDRYVLLMPVEHLDGVRPGARVIPTRGSRVQAGYGLLGRVLDGLGRPIDGKPAPTDTESVNTDAGAPDALRRARLRKVFSTGVRALDGLMTCAVGQRLGIMAGSGVGKSVLLGSIARQSCATVNVIALIGERGREVREFIEDCLGEGLRKSVVVVATSDQAALMRKKGAFTATAIAEYFRDRGENVLLLMDSVTRFAMAQRELGLAAGEPPTTKGYPPSMFGLLPRLMERAGAADRGSITAFYTVLVEGDDLNDPVADTCRAILDGHVVLSRDLASANHYPAIDVLNSLSRAMSQVVTDGQRSSAARLRSLLATYRKAEDLLNVGAYVRGANPAIDEAIAKQPSITAFLRQTPTESALWDQIPRLLEKAVA